MSLRVRMLLLLLLACSFGGALAAQTPEPSACPDGPVEVMLDPGHGGDDPGAVVEAHGLVEAELNLAIAADVAALLEAQGIAVALTRTDDTTTLGNSERGDIANACDASVFVSIHLNASPDPEVNHSLTLWGEKTKDVALSAVMLDALGALGIDPAGPRQFDNGALLRARMPSVLVEALYMTSDAEAEGLATGERQSAVAAAIAAGVLAWLAATGEGAP